jgi:hypothetical protein
MIDNKKQTQPEIDLNLAVRIDDNLLNLSKREHFAIIVLQGLLRFNEKSMYGTNFDWHTSMSIEIADDLIEKLKKSE